MNASNTFRKRLKCVTHQVARNLFKTHTHRLDETTAKNQTFIASASIFYSAYLTVIAIFQ
jgi:hypothetical protein